MSLDLNNTTFKYQQNKDGSVLFISGADGKQQILNGRDASSSDALEADLAAYNTAYIAGLDSQQPEIGADITVGTLQSADSKDFTPQAEA